MSDAANQISAGRGLKSGSGGDDYSFCASDDGGAAVRVIAERGTVKGKLFASGWGAALGFPGLILDPPGPSVDVDLFESADLPEHWARLDEFEGSGYRRVVCTVNTEEGERRARQEARPLHSLLSSYHDR